MYLPSHTKYSKTCVKRPLKIKKNILMTNGSLMKVESIAICSAILLTAILLTCIKRYLVLKTNVWSFLRVVVLHRFYSMPEDEVSYQQTRNQTLDLFKTLMALLFCLFV